MKTKKSLFYKVYFSLLAVFAILLIIFAICLNSWLADYNEGIPETVSKNFFEDNFLKLDVDSIIELSGIQPVEFETEDDLKSFIESQLTGKELSYTSISSGTDDNSKKYIVKSGDYKIATFTLAQNEKKDWYPSSLLLHLPASYSRALRILDTSKLYLNGTEVSEKYVTERTPHISAEYLPEDVKAPEWVTYSIKGLTAEPEVKIVDRNGANPTLTEDTRSRVNRRKISYRRFLRRPSNTQNACRTTLQRRPCLCILKAALIYTTAFALRKTCLYGITTATLLRTKK